jgi:DsbC/DsbD-like thiol-disulfide interchange protein
MKDSPLCRVLSRSAAFAALAIVLTAGAPQAQAQKSDSVVKSAAKASKPDDEGNQTVTITLEITDKRYHLYANPVGNDMLKTAQTTVRFSTKLEGDAKVEYPAGKLVKDETVGDYKTYEGTVTIKAKVRRAKGDTSPLGLSITFQACDDKICLLRSTVKLTAE